MSTYYICYDSWGAGFVAVQEPYGYAFNEEELKELVAAAIEDYELDPEQICIFELTDKAVKAKLSKKGIVKDLKITTNNPQ